MMKELLTFALLLAWLHGMAQEATPTLNKKNLVVKEWNTDVRTNARFLDHVTTYDQHGRKVKEEEYSMAGLQWSKCFEYQADGRLLRELTYNGKGKLDNIQKFEFNEYGRKRITYTYTPKGKLVKTKTYEYIINNE